MTGDDATGRRRFRMLPALIGSLLLVAASGARADLGARVLDHALGPVRVIGYASPAPLRVGESAWTIVVVDRASAAPVADARVVVTFEPPAREVAGSHPGHHGAAAVSLETREDGVGRGRLVLDAPGRWRLVVRLVGFAGTAGHGSDGSPIPPVEVSLDVAPAPGFWRADGLAVVAPYAALAIVALFALRPGRGRLETVRPRRRADPGPSAP